MASCVSSQGFPVSRRKVTEAQPRETRREQGARQPPVSGERSAPPPPAPTQSGGLPKPSAPLPGSPWKPAVPPEEPEEEESAKCPRCTRRPGALPSARPRSPAPPAPPARGRAAPARPARGVSPGPAPARPPASSTSSGPGAPPPWSEGSQRQGSPEPAAMDAVLEPFPADRLFPGSSFLDLGDLNESDFLNNAVRRRVCAPLPHSAPLCAARPPPEPPPRRGYTSLGRAEEGAGAGAPEGHVLRALDSVARSRSTSLCRAWTGASELTPGRAPPGGSVGEYTGLRLLGKGTSRRRRHPTPRCEPKTRKSCPRPGFQVQIARKVDPRLVLRWEAHRGALEGPETRRPLIQTRVLSQTRTPRGAASPESGTRCLQEGT